MTPPVNSKSQMIQQALEAETKAQQAYNQAGFRENALAAKAQEGDSNAENALPEAHEQKIVAQNELKNAQSNLARLTGADDPHRKKTYPRLARAEPKHAPISERSERPALASSTTRAVNAAKIEKVLSEFKVQSRSEFKGAFMDMMTRPKGAQEMLHKLEKLQGEQQITDMLKVQVPNPKK